MQYFDDDPMDTPKFLSTLRWARTCAQNVNVPTPENSP